MEHVYFSDGNTKRISWVVKTGDTVIEEERAHTDNYLDKVKIKLDSKYMFEHLAKEGQNLNTFIQVRTKFIKQLLEQRKLKIEYQLIDSKDNPASKLL